MKKKVLLLVGLMLCLLLVGCGKAKTKNPKDVIPDPYKYFSDANITLLRDDEKCVYYSITKYSDSSFDEYFDACQKSGFTDIHYKNEDETIKIYRVYDSEKNFELEYKILLDNQVIEIICRANSKK